MTRVKIIHNGAPIIVQVDPNTLAGLEKTGQILEYLDRVETRGAGGAKKPANKASRAKNK